MKYTGGHLNEEQLLDYRYGDLAEANAERLSNICMTAKTAARHMNR